MARPRTPIRDDGHRQYRGAQVAVGRGRYSLWTGDVGLAIYLWDCVAGEPRFDVF
jgi:hypothetical protein